MKILSKYKDYYDWCVGKFGMDEKMVLDRTKNYYPNTRKYEDQSIVNEYTLAICGELFYIIFYKGKAYHTQEELFELNDYFYKHDRSKILFRKRHRWYKQYWDSGTLDWFMLEKNGKTDANDKYNIPTLLKIGRNDWQGILLSEFQVGKYISPEEMFQTVYSWISSKKDISIPNKQTNKEKILSHGLDYIKSFRHRK